MQTFDVWKFLEVFLSFAGWPGACVPAIRVGRPLPRAGAPAGAAGVQPGRPSRGGHPVRADAAGERRETLKRLGAVLEPDDARRLSARALASNVWVEDRIVTRLAEIEPGLALNAADLIIP